MPRSASRDLDVVSINVSELEPPEPMERIFASLQQLQAGQLLRVRHRREPFPIYSMLDQASYQHYCIDLGAETYLIYIWPHTIPVDERFCHADAAEAVR